MPDHQHIGGSKNSNINVKRDDVNKPKKSKGERNAPGSFENFNGKPLV